MVKNDEGPKSYLPLKTLSGPKYLLSLINLFLIGIAIILLAVSGFIYLSSDENGISAITDKDGFINDEYAEIAVAEEQIRPKDDYDIISTRNIFSPERKEWVTNVVIPKSTRVPKNEFPKGKTLTKKPRKIILYGIIMAGENKKALINNPKRGAGRKKSLYVEEGDDIEGYKVKSIESDLIKLDWQGEEIIVELYSG